MKKLLLCMVLGLVATLLVFGGGNQQQSEGAQQIDLVGAVMLPENHPYFETIQRFRDLVNQYYQGPSTVNIELHHSGSLGSEQDLFEFMIQGVSVDFAIVAPSWMTSWVPETAILDAPFIFRGVDHWNRALESGVFSPIEEKLQAAGVRVIGYAGGGVRSMILNQPVRTLADLTTIEMRVQGSPLHQAVFSATGLIATPLAYGEVYNAIRTNVVNGLENEPAGLQAERFYEVAPYYVLSNHIITTRPLLFSESRFSSLPEDLQSAIIRAGRESGAFGRQREVAMGQEIVDRLVANNGLQVIPFDNTEMRNRALPVVIDFAAQLGVTDILNTVNALD